MAARRPHRKPTVAIDRRSPRVNALLVVAVMAVCASRAVTWRQLVRNRCRLPETVLVAWSGLDWPSGGDRAGWRSGVASWLRAATHALHRRGAVCTGRESAAVGTARAE